MYFAIRFPLLKGVSLWYTLKVVLVVVHKLKQGKLELLPAQFIINNCKIKDSEKKRINR